MTEARAHRPYVPFVLDFWPGTKYLANIPMTFTILSNGHGEDVIGASFAKELLKQRPDIELQVFPTVDSGKAYEGLDLEILGERKEMPSGGFIFHNFELFVNDIKAGFLQMTVRQIYQLSKIKTDVLLVVGDIYALFLSSFIRTKQRFYYQSLVSVHNSKKEGSKILNRYFMENFSYLERALIRHLVRHVYLRDAATAEYLENFNAGKFSALGNPMLDSLNGKIMLDHKTISPTIGLLPGTREHADKAMEIMLASLEGMSGQALVAWASDKPNFEHFGWERKELTTDEGLFLILKRDSFKVFFYRNRFADILASSDIIIGNAGTANEQAAALGLAVITFPVEPTYKKEFVDNQKRLLGEALTVCDANPNMIKNSLNTMLDNPELMKRAGKAGVERMGPSGGTQRIITDILARIA